MFSIIVNNVTATSDEIYKVIDAAVLRLAAFTADYSAPCARRYSAMLSRPP